MTIAVKKRVDKSSNWVKNALEFDGSDATSSDARTRLRGEFFPLAKSRMKTLAPMKSPASPALVVFTTGHICRLPDGGTGCSGGRFSRSRLEHLRSGGQARRGLLAASK